jgi:hypothetical protein
MAYPILGAEKAADAVEGDLAQAGDCETGGSAGSFGTIVDAVCEANLKVIGETPAMAMGLAVQSAAHSTGLMFQNAADAQQQGQRLAAAINAQSINMIEAIGQALTSRLAHLAAPNRSTNPAAAPSPES